jgi:hypothetical protein
VRLREIRIEASAAAADHAVVPPDLAFRWTAHHIAQLFAASLPQGFVLDGAAVFQVSCGPRGSDPQYQSVLGSSLYYVEDFDFEHYRLSPGPERDETLVVVVHLALSDIARRVGADASAVDAAAKTIRKLGYRQTLEVKNLGKRLPNGGRIKVLRCLSRDEGEAWRIRLLTRDGALVAEHVVGTVPSHLDRRDECATASLADGDYVIRTRLGREAFRCRLWPEHRTQAG